MRAPSSAPARVPEAYSKPLRQKDGSKKMRTHPIVAIGAAFALMFAGGSPAQSATMKFTGRVVHVSTDNIKVESTNGKVMSFMLLPHFDQVFQFDGKTT